MVYISLKNKILITVIGVIFFFGILATIIVFYQTSGSLVDFRKEVLTTATIQQSEIIGEIFVRTQLVVKKIAGSHEIVEYLQNNPESQDQNILHLFEKYSIGDSYAAISLMDIKGDTLVSTEESFVGKNYSFRKRFHSALAGEPYVDVAIGVTTNKLGYYFSNPVFSEDGSVIGVIVIKLDAQSVHSLIFTDELLGEASKYTEIWLVDENGVILFAEEEEGEENLTYKSLGKLDETTIESIKEQKRYADIQIKPLAYDVVQRNLDKISRVKSFALFDRVHNRKEIVIASRVRDYPFFIISEITEDGVEASAFAIACTIGAFVLMAAMMALILILIIVSKFLRPLNDLKMISREIARGNYDYRVDVKTHDELKDLADSLNKLAAESKKTKAKIDKKINERTAELEKMNKYMVDRELKMVELKKILKKLKENEDKK